MFNEVRYEFVRTIAEGGMGTVSEALQHGSGAFQKTVAIKLIREEYSAIPEFRDNFIGEARLVADLIHTNIVQIYHLGEMSNTYFMVMEYVNGGNLERFLEIHQALNIPVPEEIAAFIASRICRGLAYAHTKRDKNGQPLGIVHRDINPKNILINNEGDVKITDFGIAKARDLMYSHEGEVIVGKDGYLSPEQARKEVTDPRADIFACGIVLAELLLSQNVFLGETPEQTHENILHKPLPDFEALRPGLNPNLAKILAKALERNREDRYQTAFEFLTAIEMHLYCDGYGPTNEKLATYCSDLLKKSESIAGTY
jgi:serine/threonine-protein kinase